MAVRRAGQHARETARRIAIRYLAYLFAVLGSGVVALAIFGWQSAEFITVELVAIAAMLALDRFGMPLLDRWDRGATGEEEIGELLASLGPDGWLAIHDVDTGRGNIDHVLIGPGGLFTIETKSHGGRIAIDRIDERMLKQAYAQRKWLERVTGEQAEALLVFSRADLDRALAPRRGVLVMSGRVLCGHLLKRERRLSEARVTDLQLRLVAALG